MSFLTSERAKDYGIAAIRVMTGVVFLAHGLNKVFGMGFGPFAGFLAQTGVPFPALSAALAIGAEVFGGAALIVGLGTRLWSLPLAFTMFIAVSTVHWAGGFFLPAGYEFALTMLVSSVGLGLTGSGAFALDNRLFAEKAPTTLDAAPARRLA